jgi:hypothetical protein
VSTTTPTYAEVMAAYAEDAVELAKRNFQLTLDYSPASARLVERMAQTLVAQQPKGLLDKLFKRGPSPQDVDQVCKMLGGYLGEVLRRAQGGEWEANAQLQAVGLRTGTRWVFPHAKVHKRLTQGAEHNLEHYLKSLLSPAA